MIKFGIPSVESVKDDFDGAMVLTVHAPENVKSKRTFSLSVKASEALKIEPGMSEVAFSFTEGNFLGVIPKDMGGIAQADRLLVSKSLKFISKRAYDYIVNKFNLPTTTDTHLVISKVEDMNGVMVATFSDERWSNSQEESTTESVSLTDNEML